jgi:hypothetical protein
MPDHAPQQKPCERTDVPIGDLGGEAGAILGHCPGGRFGATVLRVNSQVVCTVADGHPRYDGTH